MKKTNIYVLLITILMAFCNQSNAQQKTAEKCILYNGKPFFPIGFYYYPDSLLNPDDKELDLIVKAGFNTIHIDVKDSTNSLSFFNQCQRKGLKIIAQFGDGFGKFGMGDVSALPTYMNHPALLGWSIAADANNGKNDINHIIERQKIVKSTKPDLQTFLSVYQNYEKGVSLPPQDFLGTGDVVGFEMYPIDSWGQAMGAFTKEEELLETERELEAFQEVNFKKFNKILVAIPQTFTWASYSKDKKARLLDADELRNITYTGMINGAKGVLNYTFGQKGNAAKKYTNYKMTSTPKLWNEACATAQEINQLKNVYLNGTRSKINLGKDSWLRLSMWKYDKKTYLIISNLHKTASQNLNYNLLTYRKIINIFKQRNASVALERGFLKGNIPAKQVQIYQID